MPINQARLYLVSYDIADPRRLVRVHRYLRKDGLPLQYSVFTMRLTARRQALLMLELAELIEPAEDDVRIYPLPEKGERVQLGQQMFPEDVLVISAGGNLMPT